MQVKILVIEYTALLDSGSDISILPVRILRKALDWGVDIEGSKGNEDGQNECDTGCVWKQCEILCASQDTNTKCAEQGRIIEACMYGPRGVTAPLFSAPIYCIYLNRS